MEYCGAVEARQRSRAVAVRMELCRAVRRRSIVVAAEVEEHSRAWAAEAKEPCRMGNVNMELRRAKATEVEE